MSTQATELHRRISQAFTGPAAPPSGRKRILVSAFTISPKRGSEPAGGWNVITRLAAYHDITVLTSSECEGEDYRNETLAHLEQHPVPGLTLHYVDPPLLARKLMVPSGKPLRPFYYIGYAAWQRAAFREARRLHEHRPFDLIHQLNMTGYREPGYLWRLDAPFVWGPIAGACNMPWSFLTLMPRKEQIFYGLRNVVNAMQRFTTLRCRWAANKASTIWYVGADEKLLIEQVWRRPTGVPMLDSGTNPSPRETPDYDGARPLRLVWSGVHIGRKAFPILLHALAPLKNRKIEVTVLGEGPQTEAWDTLATQLGVRHMVRWMGKLKLPLALEEMRRSDALVFTSLMEAASHVVLEALSMGLPVLCHDACGMSVAVDDSSGIKVPLVDVDTSVRGFTAAIRRLLDDPAELRRLSIGAARRATELTWDAKVRDMVAEYDRVLATHASTPAGRSA